jgi:hypothetical protein
MKIETFDSMYVLATFEDSREKARVVTCSLSA